MSTFGIVIMDRLQRAARAAEKLAAEHVPELVRSVKEGAGSLLEQTQAQLEHLAKAHKAPESVPQPPVEASPAAPPSISAFEAQLEALTRKSAPVALPGQCVAHACDLTALHDLMDANPASAKAAPLYEAWFLATKAGRDGDLLEKQLNALVLPSKLGNVVRAAITDSKAAPADLRWATLQAGVLTAVTLAEGETNPFEAAVAGWSASLDLSTSAGTFNQAGAWKLALRTIAQALPVDSEARKTLDAVVWRDADPRGAANAAALALGAACHWVDHGAAPAETAAAMPLVSEPLTVGPLTVQRFSAPLLVGTPTPADIGQNALVYDCGLAATFIAIAATKPSSIEHALSETLVNGVRTFTMRDFGLDAAGKLTERMTSCDDRLYVNRDGSPVFGASSSGKPSPLWFSLVEKLYGTTSYGDAEGLIPRDILKRALGADDVTVMPLALRTAADILPEIRELLAAGRPIVCSTLLHGQVSYDASPLIAAHAYAIVGTTATGVLLANPLVHRDPTLPPVMTAVVELMRGAGSRHLDPKKTLGTFEITTDQLVREIDCLYWAV